ncbi:MAG: hypothetical protein QM718_02610 [Steroidobacteraceae bacterium]
MLTTQAKDTATEIIAQVIDAVAHGIVDTKDRSCARSALQSLQAAADLAIPYNFDDVESLEASLRAATASLEQCRTVRAAPLASRLRDLLQMLAQQPSKN